MNYEVTARNVIIPCAHSYYSHEVVTINMKNKFRLHDKFIHNFVHEDKPYPSFYNINKIETKDKQVLLIETVPNDVYKFILPQLGVGKKMLCQQALFNTMIDEEFNLHLWYRFVPYNFYLEFRDRVKDLPGYITWKKCDDIRLDYFIFKLNSNEDIKHLMKDENTFSDNFINNVSKFHGINSIYYKIISNDKDYRKQLEDDLGCKIPKDICIKSKFNFKENLL